jgi:hypothetical protein
VPDIDAFFLRRSLSSPAESASTRCAKCERTPLPGERLHEMDSGRRLCDLCFAELPEDHRISVRSTRVHASDRHLAVAPKAFRAA